jgi:hypothetical protein
MRFNDGLRDCGPIASLSQDEIRLLGHPITLPLPPKGEKVYGFYDALINNRIRMGFVPGSSVRSLESNRVYGFTLLDFHRGVAAYAEGWRAFVRLTLGNERAPKNEIRSQVNVYVPEHSLYAGW